MFITKIKYLKRKTFILPKYIADGHNNKYNYNVLAEKSALIIVGIVNCR